MKLRAKNLILLNHLRPPRRVHPGNTFESEGVPEANIREWLQSGAVETLDGAKYPAPVEKSPAIGGESTRVANGKSRADAVRDELSRIEAEQGEKGIDPAKLQEERLPKVEVNLGTGEVRDERELEDVLEGDSFLPTPSSDFPGDDDDDDENQVS